MVIITDKYGNLGLGNRLFLFAHFIANAIEFDYKISYPGFYEYAQYFIGTRSSFFCSYPAKTSLIRSCNPAQYFVTSGINVFTTCSRKLKLQLPDINVFDISSMGDFEGDYNLDAQSFIESRKASRVLFVKGWTFRAELSAKKHADLVRLFFTPVDTYASRISSLIKSARKGCDLLVGVHIRQGDYKIWLNGTYYYSTSDYVNIMRSAEGLWGGARVRYLICSNEKQDECLFEGLDYVMGNADQLEDMYAFASCDYLIGPPSTYTMWASFYGSVPLFVIETLDTAITLKGFKLQ